LSAIHRDITERKTAEAKLRSSERRFRDFADSGSDWYWETDENFRFTWFSVDRQPTDRLATADLIGKTPSELPGMDPESAEAWNRLIEELGNDRGTFRGFQYCSYSPDSEIRHLSANGLPFVDEDGNFSGYRGSATDITAQVEAEQRLRQALKMEAVGQLTGGIAHDFNNLLTIILGNLQLMERSPARRESHVGNLDQHALRDDAISAAEKAARLTHRLLAFAREQPLLPRPLDVGAVVEGMRELICRTVRENIAVRFEHNDRVHAFADPSQLENAVLNLVINARDAMPDGGQLTIETGERYFGNGNAPDNDAAAPGHYVTVSVTDTGTGIPAEMQSRVFEPFFTSKDTGQGSGLGLSMVHGFARQSGGQVDIESEMGRGTTVCISLPKTGEAVVVEQVGPNTLSEEDLSGGGKIVLLVEDDPAVCESTQALVESYGYVVYTASDGPSGLKILQQNTEIDLMLTDLVMPGGMSGISLGKQAKKENPDLKILYMSGHVNEKLGVDSEDLESVRFIRKPFKMENLARELHLALLD